MNAALWIVGSLLTAVFLASGASKIARPREALVAGGYGWAEDFTPGQIKVIGVVEVLGAVGLVLPAAVGVLEVLTPLAAAGLAVLMVAAALVHVRRRETRIAANPLVLGAVAAAVAVLRLGPYGF